MLLLYEVVLWAIDGWTGQSAAGLARWVHVLHRRAVLAADRGLLGRLHSPALNERTVAGTVTHQGSLARAAHLRAAQR